MTVPAEHRVRMFHGTGVEEANLILGAGFDFRADRRRDPGDFGWGIYLTADLARAQEMGEVVLVVIIDKRKFAHIPNPYFLLLGQERKPETELEKLFHGIAFDGSTMLTCASTVPWERRVVVAQTIQREFLDRGYSGIITETPDKETVLFSGGGILNLQELR